MPRKGSHEPYKPKREYRYTVKDIADLAGMTRNALNVAKARGKIDPGNLKSVVSFLTRAIIERRLSGDLFGPAARVKKIVEQGKRGTRVSGKKTKKAGRGR
ncbi:MAG: hypothetical protein ABSC55_17975 [Syntrophorhabdales bacterium]|jgi:hypothetical protein